MKNKIHRIKPNGTVRLRGGLYNSIPADEVRMMGVANPMFEMPGGSIRLAHDDGSKLSAYGGHWPGPVKRIVRGIKRHHNAAEPAGSSDTGFRLASTPLRCPDTKEAMMDEPGAPTVGKGSWLDGLLYEGDALDCNKWGIADDVGFRLVADESPPSRHVRGGIWGAPQPSSALEVSRGIDMEHYGRALGVRLVTDLNLNVEDGTPCAE